MAFVRRKIDLTFRLGQDSSGVQYTFTEGDFDTVKVSGLRVQATIANAGTPSMGQASVIVHGLTPSLLNQLSTVSRTSNGRVTTRYYEMVIEAGDDVSGMSIIFAGQVSLAIQDMNGAPDSALHITAHAGLFEAVKIASPTTFTGSADAAVIMQNLATQNNYAFENNGVSVVLATPYLSGSPRQQMETCANAANINWTLENNTLAIWPKGGTRGGAVPSISPDAGSIGYPTNSGIGGSIAVRTLFNPQLRYGASVQVTSSLRFATGTFVLFDLAHDLESETPNGRWESSFTGSPFNVQ
ncbi:hypothetical protein WCQ02_30995 [Paraburkholderia tropica]|uniref:baseplate hub protein n=1 Tax=Paraburkholderia tropica TaxID=92647 RepID=UPI003019EDFD